MIFDFLDILPSHVAKYNNSLDITIFYKIKSSAALPQNILNRNNPFKLRIKLRSTTIFHYKNPFCNGNKKLHKK